MKWIVTSDSILQVGFVFSVRSFIQSFNIIKNMLLFFFSLTALDVLDLARVFCFISKYIAPKLNVDF